MTKVFVGGIPPQVDKDGLTEIFSQFGTVSDCIIMIDQVTQRSRCFGFVTFGGDDGPAAAARSVASQPLDIQNRKMEVKLATPRDANANKGNRGENAGGITARKQPPPGPRNIGLRAGVVNSSGEFAGLAVAYGRNGWKAGHGSKTFGPAGWKVEGWEDTGGPVPKISGFSFQMLAEQSAEPPSKRPRH